MENILEIFEKMKEDYNHINLKLLVNSKASIDEEITALKEKCIKLNGISTKFNFVVDRGNSELLKSISDLDRSCLNM